MTGFIKTVLIVGLGSIGKRHVRIVKKLFPDVNIVVLRHKQCDKNHSNSLGSFICVTSIDEAISTNPQVAIIANPAPMHIDVAKKLASNRISLLIEKPISNTSKNIQSLIDLCSQNGIILMTAYNLRFSPSLIEFKKQLELNKIGPVYSVRSEVGQHLSSWRPDSDYRNGVSANQDLGGGVLLELSHEIDYLMWIFGSIEWVKSYVSKQSSLDIDVEDNANIILCFKRDKSSNLIASLNMDFIRHDTTRKCFAIGNKGTLLWDGISGRVMHFDKRINKWQTVFSSVYDVDYTYKEEIKSFFLSVESKKQPHISGYDGMRAVSVVEAVKESSNNNSTVYL